MKDLSVHRHKVCLFRQKTGKDIGWESVWSVFGGSGKKGYAHSDNLYAALWKGLSNEEPAKGVCGASVSQSPLSDRDMREEKAKGKWQKPVLPTKRTGWLCASVRLYKRIWRSQKRKMEVVKRIIKGKTGR